MKSDEIRSAYLSFFEGKGHKVVPSSSLIPHGDPTLLLTTAGMVQFKSYFTGEETPPSPRLASCQKCFRTTDIERVGDPTHLTFFEMLGNFSIGDYFKKEAIAWAWEFVTKRLKIPEEKLWITIFLDDDEAFRYWREIGVPENRITRLGEKDNFWGPAGDSGPCGPCSEINYDLGIEFGCGRDTCAPGCECSRFSEIWNLVFTQYNQDKDGKRTPLPKPNIDTGMGLERVAAVMQGKLTVYETDVFAPMLERLMKLTGKKYGADEETDYAMRIVAEHSRGIAFLIGDGVLPSNEGRGYVLRRLLRRAALFGRRLGLDKPFLTETAQVTIDQMSYVYPELRQRRDAILRTVQHEESRFGETLNTGLEILEGEIIPSKEKERSVVEQIDILNKQHFDAPNRMMSVNNIVQSNVGPYRDSLGVHTLAEVERLSDALKDYVTFEDQLRVYGRQWDAVRRASYTIPGEDVFKLYDTYGFHPASTSEIANEHGLSADLAGAEAEMDKQREKARAAHSFEVGEKAGIEGLAGIKGTRFTGYSALRVDSAIAAIVVNSSTVKEVTDGQEAGIILEATPFYGEMGGQLGDTGEILSATGRFQVTDTVRLPPDIILHRGIVAEGVLSVGDAVTASVDEQRRRDIARNHTATHLLQMALRQVFGEHVQQRGSLVAPDSFTFDFSHLTALMPEEIYEAQRIVNDKVRQNLPVYDEEMPYRKAIEQGVIALFDEKYGETVRVLRVGRPPVSAELCGGTHITTTGEIGFFYILSERSIGSGLRRIEAVTGRRAEARLEQHLSDLRDIAQSVGATVDNVREKVDVTVNGYESARRRVESLERELARIEAEALLGREEAINGVKVLAAKVSSRRPEIMREMSDLLRERLGSAVIVLGTVYDDKPAFVAAVTPDLVTKGYDAGKLVREVAKATGGGGGGKPALAQGSGRDKGKIDEAIRLVPKLVESKL